MRRLPGVLFYGIRTFRLVYLRTGRDVGSRWKSSVDSTVPPSAKLPHTMMDVAMMTPPSSQRLAG